VDPAVALVEAYLQVNGYLTVTEHPVVVSAGRDQVRTATDLDVLALRFPAAGQEVGDGRRRHARGPVAFAADPVLEAPADRVDMIVAEVKEGPARFNPATRDRLVLAAALARFGCCAHPEAAPVVERLLRRGRARTAAGHVVRMVAFGAGGDATRTRRGLQVGLSHVHDFLIAYLRANWGALRHVQVRQPALAGLALLMKCPPSRLDGGERDARR